MTVHKDATAQSTHVATALGNDKKRRQANRAIAGEQWDSAKTPDASLPDDPDDADADIVRSDASKRDAVNDFSKAEVVKVDSELGLVFGFAIVCKRDGENYFDLQGDHITEKAMLDCSTDFMQNSRLSKDMHDADDGSVVFAFPLTADIAKALDITTKQTGLLIAMKPSDDVLAKFKDGTYTGFSIGGSRVKDEDVDG